MRQPTHGEVAIALACKNAPSIFHAPAPSRRERKSGKHRHLMTLSCKVLGERRHVGREAAWLGGVVDRDDEEACHGSTFRQG